MKMKFNFKKLKEKEKLTFVKKLKKVQLWL